MKRIKQENKTFSEKWFTTTVLLFILIGLLISLFGFFIAVVFDCCPCWIVKLDMGGKGETLRFTGIAMGGLLLVIQATVSYRRAKAMEDTVKQTEQGQRQERFKNAIDHLGHERPSVRLGGAYELFHLAKDTESLQQTVRDTEDLRQTVLEILCAHIRQTTRNEDYQGKYGEEPSEEIQSLLNLLFVQNHKVFRDCRINLRGSWLNGASLIQARLQKADLRDTQLQKADLSEVQLREADLRKAQLQEAELREAQMKEADLSEAQLREADLSDARLQGAKLSYAQLQGAKLRNAQLQKAVLNYAQLREAVLNYARLQGAYLSEARLERAVLNDAYLQGAELRNTQLQGAILLSTQLQGARLFRAKLQGAKLSYARLQGAILREAQFQGAKLSEARLQAADLLDAQLQGADLSEARLQGAILRDAELQGAILQNTQLQGIVSSDDESQGYGFLDFAGRIRRRIGQKSKFSTVVFSGGLSEEQVNDMAKEMLDSELAAWLEEVLEPHIDQLASNELPADSGAHTDPYTQEDAERWIKEYEKAVSRDVHS